MRIFSVKTDPKSPTGYIVNFSIENCSPEDRAVDYWTGKAIQTAFRQRRNEARAIINRALEMERSPS